MQDIGSRVQGSGCRVQGLGFRVQGLGFSSRGAGHPRCFDSQARGALGAHFALENLGAIFERGVVEAIDVLGVIGQREDADALPCHTER